MDNLHELLIKHWGYREFRPLQLDIIHAVMHKQDTIALMPTGGGKSICYQIPALANEGLCIVVSPLLALMQDQVASLIQRGIKSIAISSAMSKSEIDSNLDNCIYGPIKLLYISPERIASELVQERIKKMKVNLIAVDEAHCISQWGYDFRPSYLKITLLRQLLPNVPIIALSATATTPVIKDIQHHLQLSNPAIFKKSYFRANMAYMVLQEENKMQRLLKICNAIKGSGIVYVRTRRKAKEIADFLQQNLIQSSYYHAGLSSSERTLRQKEWIKSDQQVIVCTNAFGMGIDKPNVRKVVHMDPPDTVENYFQEAGRAGRDLQKAYAVLLYNEGDRIELNKNLDASFPSIEMIRNIYQQIGNFLQLAIGSGEGLTRPFDTIAFCQQNNFNSIIVYNALKILEREGFLKLSEISQPSRIQFIADRRELYDFQIRNKNADNFIKLILRTYTGLFDGYVKISENDLALKSGLTRIQVVQFLVFLEKAHIIQYLPQTDIPQITFTAPRQPTAYLSISKENLALRKTNAKEKLEALIHYCRNSSKCRSQLLLAYFGESVSERCGICDCCTESNKNEIHVDEFDKVSEEIKSLLMINPMSLSLLLTSITSSSESKIKKIIQFLLEKEKLKMDEQLLIHWME